MNSHSNDDQLFLERLIQIVEENLCDEHFGVSELAHKMRVSRSRLYVRVKALTQKSVSQLIREIRLKKALDLLKDTNLSVSEISYKVGFGSPTYFNKCFHDQFGYTPGEAKNILSEPNSKRESDSSRSWEGGQKAKIMDSKTILSHLVDSSNFVSFLSFDKAIYYFSGNIRTVAGYPPV